MAEYNKVIFVLALILVCWFSGTFSVCRKRCRANNPKNKGCGDNFECRNDSAVPSVERCFEMSCFVDWPGNYRGNMNYTESGKECLRWDSIDDLYYEVFYIYYYFEYYDYHESFEEASNFCRYPYDNHFDRPFCITDGGIEEACNIIKCAQECTVCPRSPPKI